MQNQIRWGYGYNQWKFSWQDFARVDDNLRALKVTAACGFRAIELSAGTGPWNPLGRPESIALAFGSAARFKLQVRDCGIETVSGTFYDPTQLSFEELHFGLNPTRRADHAVILSTARLHAQLIAELGGSYLAVRPFASFGADGALDGERLEAAADCWNAVGKMTRELGLHTVLHVDALSALRTREEFGQLLKLTDPAGVNLAFDTAELAIAGHDVVALYRDFHARVRHFHFKDAIALDTLQEYRLPNAERAMILAGGKRKIQRWFCEMGTPEGLVNFPALVGAMKELGYAGWVIVESDKGPQPPASSMMLNSWYFQHVLSPLLA